MDKKALEIYRNKVLHEAAKYFGVTKVQLELLTGGSENFVYGYERNDKDFILRITHSSHRNVDLIKGELDWINYLVNNGASVSRPIFSNNKELVEVIEINDSYYSVVSFEKAKGIRAEKLETTEWNANLFQRWGQAMGKIHALTKKYKPRNNSIKRPEWYEEDYYNVEKYLPPSQTIVIEKSCSLIRHLDTLPKDKDSYGLIHLDVHLGNFFVYDGEITLFDFDDCAYGWFVMDIATILFDTLMLHPSIEEDKKCFARYFMENYLKGYNGENSITSYWLKQIPDFLKLQEILIYTIIHHDCDLNNLDEWCKNFMNNRRHNIENDIPFIDIDFGKI